MFIFYLHPARASKKLYNSSKADFRIASNASCTGRGMFGRADFQIIASGTYKIFIRTFCTSTRTLYVQDYVCVPKNIFIAHYRKQLQ